MLRPARYAARWLLPVSSAPVENGAVLVDATGRILAAGPRAAVPLPDDAADVDLGAAILMPGLVNAHAHLDLSYARGLVEDLVFPDWIAALLRARRSGIITPDVLREAARMSCAEMIAAGITTVASTDDSDAGFEALLDTGLRGIVYREVFGPAPEQCAGSLATLDAAIASMRLRASDRVRVGVSPHAPYTVSDGLFEAVAEFASRESLPVAVHAAESRAEEEYVSTGGGEFGRRLQARGIATPVRGTSTIALLERTGILATAPLLIHCVRIDATDTARIAATGSRVVHCPVANARLGHGIAPVAAMRAAGITVALGSDSVASNNRVDMLEEGRTAQLLQRAVLSDPTLLPAAELLRMVTLDGADALGLSDRVGSIEPGKDADLCALRLDPVHVRPVNDPLAALFHSARACDVVLTMVGGVVLYREGRWHTLDAGAAAAAIDEVAGRLARNVETTS